MTSTAAKRRAMNLLVVVAFMVITIIGLNLRNRKIETASRGAQPVVEAPVEQPAPPSSPYDKVGDDLSAALWKTVIITAVIIAVIILGAMGMKRFWGDRLPQASSTEIQIVGRRFIGPKQSIAIVKVREKELLVGITDHSIHLLGDITPDGKEDNGTEFAVTPAED